MFTCGLVRSNFGWLSDRTRSRYGRRLPWIAYSAIPFALAQYLMWIVPRFGSEIPSQNFLFGYYVVAAIAFNMLYTMVTLPYAALTPELSHDYEERTSIASFRQLFALGGVLGSNVLSFLAFRLLAGKGPGAPYTALAAAVSVVGILSIAVCLAGVWRRAVAASPPPAAATDGPAMPLWRQLRLAFANGPYLCVCAIYLFSWLAMQFTATILPFYVESWLGLPPDQFALLALLVFGVAVLLLPVFAAISHRLGKKAAYFIGMSIWIVAQFGLFNLPPGQSPLLYVLCVMAGFGICVTYLIPNAMMPDTIELDELRTGMRREGIFYGLFVFLQKMALAIGTAILGLALQKSGYLEADPAALGPVRQPESALLAIRIAIGPLPAVSLLLGLFFAWRYPITKESHAETLRLLAERRATGATGAASTGEH
jgi:GPH family glycoside/pentoside/hexuronide:cation symporter